MLYDKLWEIALRDDWRVTPAEYITVTTGVFVVAVLLMSSRMRTMWKRMRSIETQLSRMQNEITALLQVQAAVITKLNTNSKSEIDPRGAAVEIGGGNVAGQTASPSGTSSQPESTKSGQSRG